MAGRVRRLLTGIAWRVLPREFRSRFGAELSETFHSAADAARHHGGRRAQLLYFAREVRGFVALAIALHRTSPQDDLRWALRRAGRQPLATATLVATLATTIAAVTTAFGLAEAILWRPLPFADAERLVFAWERSDEPAGAPMRVTSARFVDWRSSPAFSHAAIFGAAGFTLDTADGATAVHGVRVSPNYFETLGVRPLLGRAFAADEDEPGRHRVVVLSHDFWQRQFGGRANVIGESIRLSGHPYMIVGVMPSLMFPGWPVNPARVTVDRSAHQFWVPVVSTALATNTGSHVWGVVARLASGVTLETAGRTVASSIAETSPDSHGASIQPLREQFVSAARLPLLLLLAATIAVLAIACANLAAVQIATFESRRMELVMRTALGASAGRLARQLTFEALLSSLLAGAAGLFEAQLVLSALPHGLPPQVPFMTTPQLDLRVALFGMLMAFAAGLTLALWPILSVLTGRIASRGVTTPTRNSTYRALVVMQVATAVTMVCAAALLMQSLQTVVRRDSGFAIENVWVSDVGLPRAAFATPQAVVQFERQLRERLAATPHVQVALAYDHPLESNWSNSYTLIGEVGNTADDSTWQAELRIVSPTYFDALSVNLLDGRTFTDRDGLATPGRAVVNESLARSVDVPVIGRRVRLSPPRFTWGNHVPEEFEIVGIVEDERFRGLEAPSLPALYVSTLQFPQTAFTLLAATGSEAAGVATTLRAVLRTLEPQATITPARTLVSIAGEQVAPRRITTDVIGGLSAASLVLAALGVYGLLALAVSSRRREIGVRLAVGASPGSVGRHILAESLITAALGLAIGAVITFFANRLLEGMLVGVSARDPWTFAMVGVMLLAVAAAAAAAPAWRAARIDPAITLRPE
jgi:putative ABC transport system permease protein